MVHTRKAGAQPMPISTCPITSHVKLPASADIAAPSTISGVAASTVRLSPCMSMPMPITSCRPPKAK